MRVARGFAATLIIGAALAFAQPQIVRTETQSTNLVATVERPAIVPIPAQASSAGNFLDLFVRAYTPPQRGAVEAVVALGPAEKQMEIGRFAVFPAEPFFATTPAEQRAYRFDATAALSAFKGRPIFAQVRLVPIDSDIPATGAQLTLARIQISPRP